MLKSRFRFPRPGKIKAFTTGCQIKCHDSSQRQNANKIGSSVTWELWAGSTRRTLTLRGPPLRVMTFRHQITASNTTRGQTDEAKVVAQRSQWEARSCSLPWLRVRQGYRKCRQEARTAIEASVLSTKLCGPWYRTSQSISLLSFRTMTMLNTGSDVKAAVADALKQQQKTCS